MKRKYSQFVGWERLIHIVDWARLAAFIDGEGCIHITRNIAIRPGGKSPQYSMAITIGNTDVRLINWLHDTFGGNVYERKLTNVKHATAFTWQCSAKRAEAVLTGALPYFIIKQEQAQNALALQRLIAVQGKKPFPLSKDELDKRAEHYQIQKELNRRGSEPGVQIQ